MKIKTGALIAVWAVFGCRTAGDTSKAAPSAASLLVPQQVTAAPAQVTLDTLDRRTPLPLLPMMANHQKQNMREHLIAVRDIVAAAAANDFDGVQTAVSRIGYSAQTGQMCQHMGAAAPGFTELSLKFHHTADTIGEAAKKQNAEDVIKALGDTLAVCTSCHQTFKQQVVDDAAWSALMKMTPPPGLTHE